MDKLIIFGAGNYGKKAYEKLQYKDIAFMWTITLV